VAGQDKVADDGGEGYKRFRLGIAFRCKLLELMYDFKQALRS